VRLLRPSGLTVLSAVLLVLLPTLAVLQYRWVGQLSTAERERMQRNLANAAIQFRDTFEVQNGDGTQAIPSPENVGVLSGSVNQLFTLPASRGNAIGDVVTLSSGSAQVRVQSVTLGKTTLVRVLTEANGHEHASAWANAQVGAPLSVGSVSADGKRVILLEGAEKPLVAPLA